MAKEKVIWVCKDCGNDYPKWQGFCSGCGGRSTLVEEVKMTGKAAKGLKAAISSGNEYAKKLSDIEKELYDGFSSGSEELDRVFGGQIVRGSVTLIAGEPGFGKSTILSQIAHYVSHHAGTVLYSSGEESEGQGKKRFEERMNLTSDDIYLLHTRNIETLEKEMMHLQPVLVIVDSIQMLADPTINSTVGSVSQVNSCTANLIRLAKSEGFAIIIVGQVTKDSGIAGPKQLEHMVDTVLYLEGDRFNDLRLIRANKNRFGSNTELGVFEMKSDGLKEVKDASEFLLSNRLDDASGSAVVCISDTRPLLIEVQALVSPPIVQGTFPKRRSYGFHQKSLDIVIAVLEKRLEQHKLAYNDVIVNVAGGIKIEENERSADLGIAMAIYSSKMNIPIDRSKDRKSVILGEIGLVGEVRPIAKCEQIIKEIERAGFTDCILPKRNYDSVKGLVSSLCLHPVLTIEDAIKVIF